MSAAEPPVIAHVARSASGDEIVASLGLRPPAALLMLSGGAGAMSADDYIRVTRLIADGVARAAARARAVVIDGGTQSGVMQMMGEALAAAGRTAPHIGVAPRGKVAYPGGPASDDDRYPLEPNHSHFALVEGDLFGDETEVMYRLAAALSAQACSVAVLVNGGPIAAQEVLWNVRQRREVVVLEGSGRLADDLAAGLRRNPDPSDRLIYDIVRRGRLTLFSIASPPAELEALLVSRLCLPGSGGSPTGMLRN